MIRVANLEEAALHLSCGSRSLRSLYSAAASRGPPPSRSSARKRRCPDSPDSVRSPRPSPPPIGAVRGLRGGHAAPGLFASPSTPKDPSEISLFSRRPFGVVHLPFAPSSVVEVFAAPPETLGLRSWSHG